MIEHFRMNSLRGRLLISASAVLLFTLGLVGLVLLATYKQSVLAGEQLRLQGYIHDLLRMADPAISTGLSFTRTDADTRFMEPNSGLYAMVTSADGQVIWRSHSLLGRNLPVPEKVEPGKEWFGEVSLEKNDPLFAMSMGLIWVDHHGKERPYIFSVAETQERYKNNLKEFRQGLFFWLFGVIILLVILLLIILRWGLSPLRRVVHDLRDIEEGRKETLEGQYPTELIGLTQSINTLIEHERLRQTRYMHAMADLAHSLKTPLSVLGNLVNEKKDEVSIKKTLAEQVERLDQITRYQLQRAATSGKTTFSKPILLGPIVEKIAGALDKVYAEKQPCCTKRIAQDSVFYGEEGDVMEIVGNLLDNSYKYGEKRIQISAKMTTHNYQYGLSIIVEDDGPGIPESEIARVVQRGERADTTKAGQGIGLAVINDIVKAYGGTIDIQKSPRLGGAMLHLFLPK